MTPFLFRLRTHSSHSSMFLQAYQIRTSSSTIVIQKINFLAFVKGSPFRICDPILRSLSRSYPRVHARKFARQSTVSDAVSHATAQRMVWDEKRQQDGAFLCSYLLCLMTVDTRWWYCILWRWNTIEWGGKWERVVVPRVAWRGAPLPLVCKRSTRLWCHDAAFLPCYIAKCTLL
jgi:hypothetical protein